MSTPNIPNQPVTGWQDLPAMEGETVSDNYEEMPLVLYSESFIKSDMGYTAKRFVVANGTGDFISSNWGVIQDVRSYTRET
jgi:hypothetical protein